MTPEDLRKLRRWTDSMGRSRVGPSTAARFSEKVKRSGPDDCWEWQASCNPNGYGHLRAAGRDLLAHRISYVLEHGPIPVGLVVMHSCDNPPCCNPAHLSVGTHADNAADKVAKGRSPRLIGEASGRAKLTKAEATAIRAARAAGESCEPIGARYGIDPAHVSRIATGHRRPDAEGPAHREASVNRARVERAAALYQQGLSTTEVAKRLGVGGPCVSRLLQRAGVTTRTRVDYQPPVDLEQAIRRYEAGEGYSAIAKDMRIYSGRLRQLLAEAGVPLRGPGRVPGRAA